MDHLRPADEPSAPAPRHTGNESDSAEGSDGKSQTPATQTRAGASDAAAGFPLSARQGLMWVDDQLFPEARYHNLPLVIVLDGVLDVARLAHAWADTIAGRDSLRIAIDARSPQQRYVSDEVPALSTIKLAEADVTRWVAERCVRRLNRGGVLWDAVLLEISADRHVFYLCQDHAIVDGMSQWALFDDLAERYMGRTPGCGATFREYLQSEATYLASDKARVDKAYWEHKIGAGSAPLRPYGIARTDHSVALDRVWHDAGNDLAQRLTLRARDAAFATWSGPLSRLVVLATATVALLYRITGNREIVLAVPFANRQPRFARTSGLLMQQLFLRIEVQATDTFASLAQNVKDELVQSIRHGQSCVSSRGVDYVTLNLLPVLPTRFGELGATMQLDPAPVRGGAGAGQGDLRDTLGLQVHDFADGTLKLGFDFHAATYDAATQKRMRSQFVRVLEALADDGNQAIETVSLLADDERSAILAAARGPEPQTPVPDLVEQFALQVARRPGHVAIDGPGASLDYAHLDAVTNRLARRLRALGVSRESRVGVALPRSSAELVALLATLKAGGAYVPVDPSHPVERVRVILEDAAPEVLIAPSDSPLARVLPATTAFLPLDDIATATHGFDAAPLGEAFASEQLAYVLFTSGSTGRPKGVEIQRGAFANFLRSMASTPGLTETDRLLAITTTTFDIAGLELFLPLWVGATCVIGDRETAVDSRRLREVLERGAFSVMQATPASWRMLIDAGWRGDGRLRMFVGGEALSPELAQKLLERGAELWNLYGPTETTVWSTIAKVEPSARIVIGKPIDHTQVYILDPALQLVPVGVIGEVCIGGDGVARGYYGRPDLTEQRFVPDPFQPGKRLYRTGDLGRLLEDGSLECLGRIDHQVKIRGFRIELGEIESALRATPGVQEAVVVATGSGSAEAKLVAYWVGTAERQALFEHAREKLPHYMVPSAYVRVDAFPLTTSGKIDRKALPQPEAMENQDAGLRLPASDIERRIAAIWRDVLHTSPIGVDQEFFAIGGSSVSAVDVRNRIEQAFGIDLPLRVFFEAPTVSGIARWIGKPAEAGAASCLVRLRPQGATEPCLFMIHDGDGDVLLYRNLALQMPAEVSVYGVVPLARRGLPMVHTSVGEMADHYTREIRARQPHGPYYLSGLCAGGVIAFEVARRLKLSGESIGLLALIDAPAPGAKLIPLRITRGRWQRFSRLVSELRSHGVMHVAAEARRRFLRLTCYEVSAQQRRLRAQALVWLMENVYADQAQAWPKHLPVPSVRDIYLRALERYVGTRIDGVPTVLFRATDGDGPDQPVREVFSDPCFGWRELLGDTIEVADIEGGHSTILQDGRVGGFAGHFRSALQRARRA